MNRRNFILGLGTAATLSGAASVTGASISGSADAGANFNVIAENNLTIRRNNDLITVGGEIDNSTYDNYVNTTVDYVDTEGKINDTIGSGIENVSGPRLTVNGQENEELSMALGTPNDNSTEANTNITSGNGSPYTDDSGGTPPLEIVNNGGSDKTISAEYTYGDDAGGTGSDVLTDSEVAQLFTFSVNDNDDGDITDAGQVSPGTDAPNDPGEGSSNNYEVKIPAGVETTVDFTINYSSALEEKIANGNNGDYDFASGGFANVDLLTTVTFGEVDGT